MLQFKTLFNNLSLYKKILVIVSAAMALTLATFFASLHFLTKRYEEELYQANAQALNYVSATVAGEMELIENISGSIISDAYIQENLYLLHENPGSNRAPVYKRDTYQTLFSYSFKNDYIKSINILPDDGSNICMGNSDDIKRFDSESLRQISQKTQGRITWLSSIEPGQDVCLVRMIRQLKFLRLNQLADLCMVVDMERLITDALSDAGYPPENSRFILMEGGKRIYPSEPYCDSRYPEFLADMSSRNCSYTISTIDEKKAFIISGSVPLTGWEYLYFQDYDPIFYRIQSAKTQVLAVSVLSFAVALFTVWLVFGRILKHLDFLVEKIRCFGNGEPPPQQIRTYDYHSRRDEIGQLHRSFDQMTKSVKVLRDENYDKQLLLRDATIRMLQQQINPHFLYNTLDTINWMAQKYGADDISVMVRSLGNLFRASISGQEDFIPLSQELSFLDNYIRIQNIRFKDRLSFQLDVPEDISSIQVPKLCIQPLVENALKHAMEDSDQLCTIIVSVTETDSDYQIQVANTGSHFEEDFIRKLEHHQIIPQGSGVGLANIHSRMKLLYGSSYGLICYNQKNMAVVMLTIPKEPGGLHAETNDCR